jgi:hypothetical protein
MEVSISPETSYGLRFLIITHKIPRINLRIELPSHVSTVKLNDFITSRSTRLGISWTAGITNNGDNYLISLGSDSGSIEIGVSKDIIDPVLKQL